MNTSKDKWFEIWFDQGEDLLPNWLLIVIPDRANPDLVMIYDPFEKRIIHSGQSYEDTCIWLREDEFELVEGRIFPDDGFPLATSKIG